MSPSDTARKRAREWLEYCGQLMGGGNLVILPEVEESLAELLDEFMSENMCDVCAGTGDPGTGRKCMCEGSGKMSDAARYLRRELVIHQTVCMQGHTSGEPK
jgi:hypothetical protein